MKAWLLLLAGAVLFYGGILWSSAMPPCTGLAVMFCFVPGLVLMAAGMRRAGAS